MDIQTLCEKIQMPEEMTDMVVSVAQTIDFCDLSPISLLMDRETGLRGFEELTAVLGDDPLGVRQLACQLYCACLCYNTYREMGIPDQIYYDTMTCYTRFVTECFYYRDGYQFDRGWWTWRQLSMCVFRLGELEYELRPNKTIAMHIPTGAKFSPEDVDSSLTKATEFLREFFPEYVGVPFTCNSWLLSPSLEPLLPDSSNIINFQRRFCRTDINLEPMDYVSWLFQRLPDVDPKDLPENTSLQSAVKKFVLNGGRIGNAAGYLITNKE